MQRIPTFALLTCLCLAPPAAAGPEKAPGPQNVPQALARLISHGAETGISGQVDLDQVPQFRLYDHRPGLYFLFSGQHYDVEQLKRARQVVVLIHGVDEPGDNWDTAVRLLVQDPTRLVFFFIWTKWNRPHSLEYWIGLKLTTLARAFSGRVPEMVVVAHSAGGLLMLQALCRPAVSRLCAYERAEFPDIQVHFHTIASPLGGFGMHGTSLASLFAGPVTSHVGSQVTFYDIIPDLDLTIWKTSLKDDGVLRQSDGWDMRLPRFSGEGPDYKQEDLPGCTHDEAILEGILRIFGLKRPASLPGVETWNPLYRNEGVLTPHPPRQGNEWHAVEQVPRKRHADPVEQPKDQAPGWHQVDEPEWTEQSDGGDGEAEVSEP